MSIVKSRYFVIPAKAEIHKDFALGTPHRIPVRSGYTGTPGMTE